MQKQLALHVFYKAHYKYIFILFMALYGCNTKLKTSAKKVKNLYPSEHLKVKDHNDWAVKHYPKRIKKFKEKPLDFGDIVFIGNSLTEGGGDWSKKLNNTHIKNRGISGDNTNGVLLRLNEIKHYKPKAVFLLIGINDLNDKLNPKQSPNPEYVGHNILKITNKLHKAIPETKLYVQTLLPALDSLLMPHITTVNNIIKNNENKNVYEVIDLHTAFIDANNVTKKELFKDRLHLNAKGYKVWSHFVKDYIAN